METIKSKFEFNQVFTLGQRYNQRLLGLIVYRGFGSNAAKVAFVAPRRVGNAVIRNRSKRVLREAALLCNLPCKGSYIILIATKRSAAAHPHEVAQELHKLLIKSGLR